jgi:uncharacterized membrane protein
LGIQLSIIYLLATKIKNESVGHRKIWQTIFGLVIICGLISYGVNSQAKTWWNKVISYGNPQVAKIINQANRPLLISDASGINYGNVFSLSYLLDPKVKFQLIQDQSIPQIPDVFTDIFLLNPSDIWRQKIETSYKFQTEVVYSDNHYLVWRLFKTFTNNFKH